MYMTIIMWAIAGILVCSVWSIIKKETFKEFLPRLAFVLLFNIIVASCFSLLTQ